MRSRVLASLVVVVGCAQPSTAASPPRPSPAPVPPPAEPAPHVPMPKECRDAPLLQRRSTATFRFDPGHRVRAVRVEVTTQLARAERDVTKGDGEIGFGGAHRGLDFQLYDAGGKLIDGGTSQACFDHHARLPDVPGTYCLVLAPSEPGESPVVRVDYAARMHGQGVAQMAGFDAASIETICGSDFRRAQ